MCSWELLLVVGIFSVAALLGYTTYLLRQIVEVTRRFEDSNSFPSIIGRALGKATVDELIPTLKKCYDVVMRKMFRNSTAAPEWAGQFHIPNADSVYPPTIKRSSQNLPMPPLGSFSIKRPRRTHVDNDELTDDGNDNDDNEGNHNDEVYYTMRRKTSEVCPDANSSMRAMFDGTNREDLGAKEIMEHVFNMYPRHTGRLPLIMTVGPRVVTTTPANTAETGTPAETSTAAAESSTADHTDQSAKEFLARHFNKLHSILRPTETEGEANNTPAEFAPDETLVKNFKFFHSMLRQKRTGGGADGEPNGEATNSTPAAKTEPLSAETSSTEERTASTEERTASTEERDKRDERVLGDEVAGGRVWVW